MKAILAKKSSSRLGGRKKVADPRGIKLTDIPGNVTEAELVDAIIEKFGPVERCFMPMEMGRILKTVVSLSSTSRMQSMLHAPFRTVK